MRIKIAGRIYEKSIPEEKFPIIKEKVKSVCRFEPKMKIWVFDPRKAICGDPSILTEFGVTSDVIKSEMEKFENEIKKIFRERMKRGQFAFIPCKEVKAPFRMDEGFAIIDLNDITGLISKEGPIRAYEEVINSINGYYLKEHLEKLEGLFSLKKEVLLKDNKRNMLVQISYPEESILNDLEKISKVKYYIKTLKEVQVREIRVLRRRDNSVFEAPFFLFHKIREIAASRGYELRDEVEWPEEDVILYKNFSLYSFQEDAIDKWENNGRFGTIVMPTGAGKTYVGLEALFRTSKNALICVVTEELAKQWSELIKEKLSYSPGIFTGKKKEIKPITVGIYNSVAKHIDELYDHFSLIIFDEVHHVPASTFKEVAFRSKAKYRLGLSATPERADGNNHLIFLTSGNVVYEVDYEKLLKMGFLSPLRHHLIYVELSEEEKRFMSNEIMLARNEDERRLIEKKYALKARAKIDKVIELLRNLKGRKILIFTEYVDQAEEVYKKAKERGYKVELLIGKTTGRSKIFDKFRKGEVNVIVTTKVLDEGIDVPDADVAIIVSGSGSKRQMAQRVGRIVRGGPGKIADVYEIVTKDTIEERLSKVRRRGLPLYKRRGARSFNSLHLSKISRT